MPHKKNPILSERIAGLAGKKVTATGTVLERDGVKGLRLLKIQ